MLILGIISITVFTGVIVKLGTPTKSKKRKNGKYQKRIGIDISQFTEL